MPPTPASIERLARARRKGLTFNQIAAELGVHPATLYRWQARDEDLARLLRQAARARREETFTPGPRRRPKGLPKGTACPRCGEDVVVRSARIGCVFWGCADWPHCTWSSWRPPSPWTCQRCGEVLYWSHRRKTVVCDQCRQWWRVRVGGA